MIRLDESRLAYVMLTMVALVWGGTTVGGKFLVGDFPPVVAAGSRTVLASAFLFFFLRQMEGLVFRGGVTGQCYSYLDFLESLGSMQSYS